MLPIGGLPSEKKVTLRRLDVLFDQAAVASIVPGVYHLNP